jgi:hypothetical protein
MYNNLQGRKCFDVAVDTTAFSDYEIGGVITERRMPKTLSFASLEESLINPGDLIEVDGYVACLFVR